MSWTLPADELHVWRVLLEREPHVVAVMRGVLSGEERSRADRFRFERGRSRFIVGRALLRELLARYVGCALGEIPFSYGEFQKPTLADGPWINLSHSGPVVLYAFSAAGESGSTWSSTTPALHANL